MVNVNVSNCMELELEPAWFLFDSFLRTCTPKSAGSPRTVFIPPPPRELGVLSLQIVEVNEAPRTTQPGSLL